MFAVGKRRLLVVEFLTVCLEAANPLNERPIRTLLSADSDLSVHAEQLVIVMCYLEKSCGLATLHL